ncbi:MAG: glycosyltransferase family 39 protein [Nitrospirae bacterium]|nr:glycosyltransferase family 39 protein [Nitrospirota bacterium]MBI5694217.1 glycosyltransferase family 39 protein [Nitrospirota bacterium]
MVNGAGGRRHWAYLASLVLVYAVYASLIHDRGINLFGEGELLGGALGILQGKVLYRDIVTVYAPGQYYLLALLFDVFGENLLVAHWMLLAVRFTGAVLLFFLCRRLMPDLFASLACLLYMFVSGPWFKVFFSFFNIPAVLCMMRYSDGRDNRWLMAAGLFSGLGVIFRQDTGLFMMVLGMAAVLVSEWRIVPRDCRRALRSAASFVLPALAVVLPAVGYFYSQGALGEMFYWCFRWAVSVEYAFGLPFPNILDLPDLAGGWEALRAYLATKLFYYLPVFVILAATAVFVARLARGKGRREDGYLAIVLIWGYMLTYKDLMVPLYVHTIQAALPLYVLLCYLLSLVYMRSRERFSGGKAGRAVPLLLMASTVAIPVVMACLHLLYADNVPYDYMKRRPGQALLELDRAPVYSSKAVVDAVRQVAGYVTDNTTSDDYIFADTVPGFYFLTDRKNASRYGVIQPMIFSRDPGEEKDLVDTLREKAVYLVHFDFTIKRRRTWNFPDYAPLLDRFMREECVLVKQAGPYKVYRNPRLRPGASPAAP